MIIENIELIDSHPNSDKKIPVTLEIINGQLFIRPNGYGDCSSYDGEGVPIMIEVWDKELRVVVWSDINKEDPETISLEGAREDKRNA